MDFVLQTPSLRHLALVKVVAELWSQPDIWPQITEAIDLSLPLPGSDREETAEWKAIEGKVQEKLSVLALPESCKELAIALIKPLGIEILKWCTSHYYEDSGGNVVRLKNLPKQLCWTFLGAIDYARTAEIIAQDEKCSVLKRYKSARLRCLRDDNRQLTKPISEYQMNELRNKNQLFWTLTVKGELDELDVITDVMHGLASIFAFCCAIGSGSQELCDHIIAKIRPDNFNLLFEELQCLSPSDLNKAVFYLWPKMDEEQRELLGHSCFGKFLQSLLCWPYQPLFLETAKRGQRFLTQRDYNEVLDVLFRKKIYRGHKDYDYYELLHEFWHLTPDDAKRDFRNCLFNFIKLNLALNVSETMLKLLVDLYRLVVSWQ